MNAIDFSALVSRHRNYSRTGATRSTEWRESQAQIIVEVSDEHFTNDLVGPLQIALSREVPGARIDIWQLETDKPVGIPISARISGANLSHARLRHS